MPFHINKKQTAEILNQHHFHVEPKEENEKENQVLLKIKSTSSTALAALLIASLLLATAVEKSIRLVAVKINLLENSETYCWGKTEQAYAFIFSYKENKTDPLETNKGKLLKLKQIKDVTEEICALTKKIHSENTPEVEKLNSSIDALMNQITKKDDEINGLKDRLEKINSSAEFRLGPIDTLLIEARAKMIKKIHAEITKNEEAIRKLQTFISRSKKTVKNRQQNEETTSSPSQVQISTERPSRANALMNSLRRRVSKFKKECEEQLHQVVNKKKSPLEKAQEKILSLREKNSKLEKDLIKHQTASNTIYRDAQNKAKTSTLNKIETAKKAQEQLIQQKSRQIKERYNIRQEIERDSTRLTHLNKELTTLHDSCSEYNILPEGFLKLDHEAQLESLTEEVTRCTRLCHLGYYKLSKNILRDINFSLKEKSLPTLSKVVVLTNNTLIDRIFIRLDETSEKGLQERYLNALPLSGFVTKMLADFQVRKANPEEDYGIIPEKINSERDFVIEFTADARDRYELIDAVAGLRAQKATFTIAGELAMTHQLALNAISMHLKANVAQLCGVSINIDNNTGQEENGKPIFTIEVTRNNSEA